MLADSTFAEVIQGLSRATGLTILEGGAGDSVALPYIFYIYTGVKSDQGYQYIKDGANLKYSATDMLRFIAVGTSLQVGDAVKKMREWFATQGDFNVRIKREGQINYQQQGKIYESRSLLDVEILYTNQITDDSGAIEHVTVNNIEYSRV